MKNEIAKQFLESIYNKNTQASYRIALEEFIAWYKQTTGESPDWQTLKKAELEQYIFYLQTKKRYRPASIYAHTSAIRSLLRSLGRTPPVLKLPRQERKPIKALSENELNQMLACIEDSPRDYAIVCLMAKAGMRVGEVINLEISDLEINEKSGWALIRSGKGNKNRRVPLNSEVRQALKTWLDLRPSSAQCPNVFISRTGKPLNTRDIQRKIADLVRSANLEGNITPHTLRHTFATRFIEKSGSLASLQIILGHSHLNTTSRYLHPTEDMLMNAVEAV